MTVTVGRFYLQELKDREGALARGEEAAQRAAAGPNAAAGAVQRDKKLQLLRDGVAAGQNQVRKDWDDGLQKLRQNQRGRISGQNQRGRTRCGRTGMTDCRISGRTVRQACARRSGLFSVKARSTG